MSVCYCVGIPLVLNKGWVHTWKVALLSKSCGSPWDIAIAGLVCQQIFVECLLCAQVLDRVVHQSGSVCPFLKAWILLSPLHLIPLELQEFSLTSLKFLCRAFLFFYPHLRTFFSLLLERERERNIMSEKHWLVVSCMCLHWELNPQSRYVPWPGIEPTTFGLWDGSPNSWAPWPGPRSVCKELKVLLHSGDIY